MNEGHTMKTVLLVLVTLAVFAAGCSELWQPM